MAFIVAGCTHATYCRALRHALVIDAVCPETFMSTIVKMYPVVKQFLDEISGHENDTAWFVVPWCHVSRWYLDDHSKNATFSIRNYFNGAILYYAHLSQKGRDKVIQEELYQGTSKSAEGYGARLTLRKAKEDS